MKSRRKGVVSLRDLLFIGAFALVTTILQGHQRAYAQTRNDHAHDGKRVVKDFRDALDEDWTWVRENPQGWRLTESGLEILVEPGTMWSKIGDAKNVLLRTLPANRESGIDITCELWHSPKKRWEQANLVWYFDDGHMVKLGLEIENGVANVIMGSKENNQGKTLAIIPYTEPDVQLRFNVNGDMLVGYFRKLGTDQWTKAAETTLPPSPHDTAAHVSLQCYGGEADSNRWARFGSLTIDDLSKQNHWPRFRGADATGVAPDNAGLPTTGSATENFKWVVDVPGLGWSCPVVWDDRVFLTTVVSDQPTQEPEKEVYRGEGVRDPAPGIHRWMVYCFDLSTGEKLWQHEAHVGQPQVPRHPKSTYAEETPTTDGQRLYVLFGGLGLWCYDLEGELLWVRRIEPKKTELDYSAASSPVVHDGQVFVVHDNLEESWIASFDAQTGEERWRAARDETRSWSTPLVWENAVRTEIVVAGENRNCGYSLDGELLWEFKSRIDKLMIPSPLTAHSFCYISSGFVAESHRPAFALKPGVRGDIAPDGDYSNKEAFAWYQDQSASYNPSQIVYGDYLDTLYYQGFLTYHHARTGEEIYGKQRFSPNGSFTASPFAYNGKLFCLSEDGRTFVIQLGPEFDILHRNPLDERCISSPAIIGDNLLIRTASRLYCLSNP